MALTYYLKIDGIAGDSTSKGHVGWFKLAAFSFGDSNSGSATGGAASVGAVNFQDLFVALSNNTALAALLARSADGKFLSSLVIEGVAGDATDAAQTVYDLTLNNVLVSSVSGGDSVGGIATTQVSFNYGQIGLVTTSQNPDGSLGARQTFGWDLTTKTAIDPATLLVPTTTLTAAVPDPVTYFLRIDGIAGDSTSKGHEGWFELSAFNLGESNSGSASGAVVGAGKVSFSDLRVLLTDSTALTALLARGADGKFIAAIEIEGVTGGSAGAGQTVYDLTLNSVLVSSVSEGASSSGDGPATSVTFNFGRIGLVTTSQNPDGSLGPQQAFGWDLLANTSINPAELIVPTSPTIAPAAEAVTFFVRIDGIAGDSISKGHEGWFELSAFSFGESNAGSVSGGGAVAGKTNFQDLSLILEQNSALIALLDRSATGKIITALEIEGVTGGTLGAGQTVYDLTLNNVLVSSVSAGDSTGGTATTQVSFNYGQIGLVTTSQNPDGSFGAQQAFGWNLVTNAAIDPATLVVPTNTSVAAVPDPVTYFLKIDGVAGDSTSKGHQGWFELAAFSLGESNSGSVSGGAAGVGKVNFQDLSVTLADNTALAALLARGADGKHIAALEIEGVTVGAGGGQTVYDLTLNDVLVSSVAAGDSVGGEATTQISFNFGQIGIVTTSQNPDGSLGAQQAFGWDLVAKATIDPATLVVPTNTATAGVPDPVTYYVRIDGIAGDSTSKGHAGWFELTSFSLGESNSGSVSAGAAGVGRVNFQDLHLTLANNTALTALLARNADGKFITALEIEGVTGGTTGPVQTVYDLTLNNVLVSSVSEGVTGGEPPFTQASFNFGRIGLVTTGQNPDGSFGVQQSFGWDLTTNLAIDPATLAVPNSSLAAPAANPVTYYLKIDGLVGGSTSKGHEGWFELPSFSLGQSNSGSASGGVLGTGRVNFQDLSVALTDPAALAALLTRSADGKHIAAVEIEGVSGGPAGAGQTVYDLTLNDVLVSSVAAGASSGDTATTQVSFNFGLIGLVTTSQNPDGSFGAQRIFGWDIALNRAINPASLTVPDNQAPSVAISSQLLDHDTGVSPSGATDLVTNDGHVTLTGTAADDAILASVHIFDGAIDLGAATLTGATWTFSTLLTAGAHSLRAVATDATGKATTTAAQPEIIVDDAAPSAAIASQFLTSDTGVSSIDRVTSDGRVTLTGTAADDRTLAFVKIVDGLNVLGFATVIGAAWSFDATLVEGQHAIQAIAYDLAGNSATTIAQSAIIVDTIAPSVAIASQSLTNDNGVSSSDLVTSDGRVTLNGTAADGVSLASVRIFDGATDLGLATLSGTSWSFGATLAVGTHALKAVATDTAGNITATATQPQISVIAFNPIVGQPGQTTVTGTAGADTIIFGTSNLFVNAGTGDDIIAFAAGTSFGLHAISGGAGVDTLDLSALTTAANVNLTSMLATGPQVGVTALSSIENVIGGSANDTIAASTAVNRFTGGNGADTFTFASLGAARNGSAFSPTARDTITDFHTTTEVGAVLHDVINLRGIDAIQGGSDNAFVFNASPWDGVGNAFTAAGQLRFQYVIDASGQEHTIVMGNVNTVGQGNGLAADFQIDLLGHHVLSAPDFIF